jgi:hypothetical protein
VLAVVVTVVVVAVIVQQSVAKARARKTERRLIDTSQHSAAMADTIFATVVAEPGNPEAAIRTLESLFSEADVPLRITVALYDTTEGADDDDTGHGNGTGNGSGAGALTRAGDRRAGTTRLIAGFIARGRLRGFPTASVLEHIHVLRVPQRLYPGRDAAREQLERFYFAEQKFVMGVAAGAVMARGWDTFCVKTLRVHLRAVARPMLTAVLERSPFPPRLTTVGTFLTLPDPGGEPAPRRFRRPPPGDMPVQALGWCDQFFFGAGARVEEVPFPSAAEADGTDPSGVLMLYRLAVQGGWTLFHPAIQVARITEVYVQRGGDGPRADRGSSLALYRTVAPALDKLGLRVHPARACLLPTTRSRVGLTAKATRAEVELKLGSMDEYASLLTQAELGGPR